MWLSETTDKCSSVTAIGKANSKDRLNLNILERTGCCVRVCCDRTRSRSKIVVVHRMMAEALSGSS